MLNQQFSAQDSELLEQIMQARRDVRGNRFATRPVAQKLVDKVLQAASYAPSVGFSQPWEFVMVSNQSTKQAIAESFRTVNQSAQQQFGDTKQQLYQSLKLEGIMEAPINIAVFYRPSKLPVLGQSSMQETGKYSVVCAIQNMWLMARSLNLGIGWVSILEPQEVKQVLSAPEDAELVAYLCLGHVKEFLDKPELEELNWEKRKPLESCVFDESY
ncbi:MAG: 5,6-dimethylbenzimidazole synthase [Kangiellaceae bacterium]|nr:5,6-dimethylbenzimidazole synthase [Kangiellaceae bacterium]